MAKIAIELERALARKAPDHPGRIASRIVARGDGWCVEDVVCTSGPRDRRFEEQHGQYAIAIVLAGSFHYRCGGGGVLMTPGSLMLGNPAQCYECGHEHGEGDRCVSFSYEPGYFERLAADAGGRGARSTFRVSRLPPLRALASVTARAAAGVIDPDGVAWEELAVILAARAATLAADASSDQYRAAPHAEARVTRAVRMVDRSPAAPLTLTDLARTAGLSPYHFLRTFEQVTGVTPHRYVVRARLREAAMRLAAEPDTVLDIALDCGFGDVSNFNRAFRSEFDLSPRAYRRSR